MKVGQQVNLHPAADHENPVVGIIDEIGSPGASTAKQLTLHVGVTSYEDVPYVVDAGEEDYWSLVAGHPTL